MRRRILLSLGALAALLVLLVAAAIWISRSTPWVRDRVVTALNERFDSQIELGSLQLSVLPRPSAAGTGLTFRHQGRTDVPPLISVGAFEASAGLAGLFGDPVRLSEVRLQTMTIRVPRRPRSPELPPDDVGSTDALREKAAPPPPLPAHPPHGDSSSPILIDRLVSREARLEIASGRPGRLPRNFEIHDLVMSNVGGREPWRFQAGITNPVPRGRVESNGEFGPWHEDDPGLTPIRGQFTFSNADMNVIKGIGGTLSSVGTYAGVLQRLDVDGQAEIPDFSLDLAGQPVPLTTRYKTIVDGTNGDTWLERVEARLGESTIVATGAVVRTEDVKGRGIALDVRLDDARIEDVLRLAVKADQPPLTGTMNLTTTFLMPAGEDDVIDRLELDGQFNLAEARFTNVDVQKRINELSERGRGDDGVPQRGSVVSNLTGRFVLRNAAIAFRQLQFSVPGARVQLTGRYNLHSEELDFTGDLLVEATLAEMTTGFKSLLARLAQPLFRGPNGGSRLPIRITGVRSKPSFRLDVRRVFSRD